MLWCNFSGNWIQLVTRRLNPSWGLFGCNKIQVPKILMHISKAMHACGGKGPFYFCNACMWGKDLRGKPNFFYQLSNRVNTYYCWIASQSWWNDCLMLNRQQSSLQLETQRRCPNPITIMTIARCGFPASCGPSNVSERRWNSMVESTKPQISF